MTTAAPPFTGLGEVHRHYLEQRGLTADTITDAGFYSAPPGELPRLAGRPVPDETSGLVIPYPNAPHFCRVRLFPPIPTEDGKVQKFGQPQGSGVRAYTPRRLQPVLQDASLSLAITEGEVKAEALTQAGWPCIGVGGVWNFRLKDLPREQMIKDLEDIAWTERIVYLVPDSDAWIKEQVLLGVFTLGRLLEERGATVMVLKLPALPGQDKTGADDFLAAKGPAAFRRLVEKATTLGDRAFRPFRQREKRLARATPAANVPPELAGRLLHPAISFEPDGFAAVGIVSAHQVVELITSERTRYSAGSVATVLQRSAPAYPDLLDRWPLKDLLAFLRGDGRHPTFAEAVGRAIERVEATLELRREAEAVLLGIWVVASYFHPVFPAFPRLDLRGERGSGKSKALAVLAALSFNGLLRIAPTPAVLFRLTEIFRATLCLDEIEGLDREDRRTILAMLNAGYRRGARVDRCEGDDHRLRSWSVYAPVALAGIAGLNRVTEDRAITLVLTRGTNPARLNAIVDPNDERFAAARGTCYRLLLLRWKDVARAWEAPQCPTWLVGRERELWSPLLTIAHLADVEGDLGLREDLLELAREQGEERAGLSGEAEALMVVLRERLNGGGELVVSPRDLCEPLGRILSWEHPPSPERVGRLLKRLGFPRAPRSSAGVRYRVTLEQVVEIEARHTAPVEGDGNLHNLQPGGTVTPQLPEKQDEVQDVGLTGGNLHRGYTQ